MITVIIETRNEEDRLARALAALVPAATEGFVRDVVVVDHGSSDGTLIVADAAGCTIVMVRSDDRGYLLEAVGAARGEWLLFLSASVPVRDGWQADAFAFMDRVTTSGRPRSAILRRGRFQSGLMSRMLALVSPGEGALIAKSAWLSRAAASPQPASGASSASGVRRGAA